MPCVGPVAQLVRAPPCHGGGRGFESHPGRSKKCIGRYISLKDICTNRYICLIYNVDLYGILAQLGEHLPYKQRVIGSSPIGPTK